MDHLNHYNNYYNDLANKQAKGSYAAANHNHSGTYSLLPVQLYNNTVSKALASGTATTIVSVKPTATGIIIASCWGTMPKLGRKFIQLQKDSQHFGNNDTSENINMDLQMSAAGVCYVNSTSSTIKVNVYQGSGGPITFNGYVQIWLLRTDS